MHVHKASAQDIVTAYGIDAWLLVDKGKAVAMGGFRREHGKVWAFLDVFGKAKPMPLMRAMLTILQKWAAAPVYVMQDETFPQSSKLLYMLGFGPTDEMHYGMKVWTWPRSP
jgi:hypothetical protein